MDYWHRIAAWFFHPGPRETTGRVAVVAVVLATMLALHAWRDAGLDRDLPESMDERVAWVRERAGAAPTITQEIGWLNQVVWEDHPAARDLLLWYMRQPGELRSMNAARIIAERWLDDEETRRAVARYYLDPDVRAGDRFIVAGILVYGSDFPEFAALPPVPPGHDGLPYVDLSLEPAP